MILKAAHAESPREDADVEAAQATPTDPSPLDAAAETAKRIIKTLALLRGLFLFVLGTSAPALSLLCLKDNNDQRLRISR